MKVQSNRLMQNLTWEGCSVSVHQRIQKCFIAEENASKILFIIKNDPVQYAIAFQLAQPLKVFYLWLSRKPPKSFSQTQLLRKKYRSKTRKAFFIHLLKRKLTSMFASQIAWLGFFLPPTPRLGFELKSVQLHLLEGP